MNISIIFIHFHRTSAKKQKLTVQKPQQPPVESQKKDVQRKVSSHQDKPLSSTSERVCTIFLRYDNFNIYLVLEGNKRYG